MTKSIFLSLLFHTLMIILTALTLPFMTRAPIDLPPILSVDLIQITDNTSIPFAAKAAKNTQALLDKSVERLSTGTRINSSKDDIAGQSILTRLNAQIQGFTVRSRNAADGNSLLDTAEEGMQAIHATLLRMRELAIQASNGTLEGSDRGALDAEAKALESEITRKINYWN